MARLLYNPEAGGRRARRAVERLSEIPDLELRTTRDIPELTREARSSAERGRPLLLVAGGDGTVHHAIQALAGSDCALGIVPTGSCNDFARALGVDADPVRAARAALGATHRRVDLGRLGDRVYAGVAAIGFDSAILGFIRDRNPGTRRGWVYPYAALRTMLSFEPPEVAVDWPGGSHSGRVLLTVVANSPRFGGGMQIAPDARLDDGWLDLVIVEAVGRPTLLGLLPRLYRGRHVGHSAVRTVRVREAQVRCDPPLCFHGDGEPMAQARPEGTRIEVWPGALRVAVARRGVGT